MKKMDESEYLRILRSAEIDALEHAQNLATCDDESMRYYNGEPFGDEVEGQSQVVSTDVADVVEADMPALARIFLGAKEILTFEPNGASEAEEQETKDKTKYINWLVRNQRDSFKIIHDWIKGAEIRKISVVKYFIDTETKVQYHEFTGIDQAELEERMMQLADNPNVVVEIEEQEPDEYGLTFDGKIKTTVKKQTTKIVNVPPESFRLSKNAVDLDTAILVGDVCLRRRGELVADGYDKKKIADIPKAGSIQPTGPKNERFKNDGSYSDDHFDAGWANEEVEISDLYVLVDKDGDGVAERRHVIKSDDVILLDEPFNHVPYASLSTILMPHKAVGRSRAEIVKTTQRVKSVIVRQTLNNMYMVNNAGLIVSNEINFDDLLTVRPNRIIRKKTAGTVDGHASPLITEFVGDKALQIVQYMDQARAQTTGSLMASQGLDADAISKETATRFRGVESQGAEKLELVARVFAETGFRKLYEGLCWLVSNYQDTETEFRVLGRPFKVNPKAWKYDNYVESTVGLGAGKSENTIANLTAIYQLLEQLKARGSALVDEKKIYNALSELLGALDISRVDDYINDPENPDELLMAENEQLKGMLEQMKIQLEQMQNPLAEAETIKAQAKLIEAQGKQELNLMQMQEQQRQFNEEMALELRKVVQSAIKEFTKLELEYGVNVPGSAV